VAFKILACGAQKCIHTLTTPPSKQYQKHQNRMTRFRPCIDLHAGSVKQIVGGTLSTEVAGLKTNFISEHPSAFYAELYRKHDLRGGHVIMLGPGNDGAAREALAAWPEGLQIGGGIKDSNAKSWIEAGAERVCNISILSISSRVVLSDSMQ
jgi:phosphoribosylformimino-5-aminoimidazole carboxamide ribotide isomerase